MDISDDTVEDICEEVATESQKHAIALLLRSVSWWIEAQRVDLITALLAFGWNPNAHIENRETEYYYKNPTPYPVLHVAWHSNTSMMMQAIMEAGADVNAITSWNASVLTYASTTTLTELLQHPGLDLDRLHATRAVGRYADDDEAEEDETEEFRMSIKLENQLAAALIMQEVTKRKQWNARRSQWLLACWTTPAPSFTSAGCMLAVAQDA
jgi:hypothetical protein